MKYSGSKWGLGLWTPGSVIVCSQEGFHDIDAVESYPTLKEKFFFYAVKD